AASEKPTAYLAGHGLYLGHLYSHYGHFITEGLGALWPLVEGEAFDYYAMHPFIFGDEVQPYMSYVFSQLGIPTSAVSILREPTLLEDVTIPERIWSVNCSVNAAFRRILTHLAEPATTKGPPLYLSRRLIRNRNVSNEEQVEAIF